MNNEHSLAAERGVSSYIQASAYAPSRRQGVRVPPRLAGTKALTIAISRETGIDAGSYARAIGEQLGWPVWDHELLELVATRLGSNVRELEWLDERPIGWLQESIEAFLVLHSVNQHSFALQLRQAVEDLAASGSCVIVGRGAPHILASNTCLKIRLVAPREQRIAAFRKQMGFADTAHAARELEKIDRERVRFVSEHCHKDPLDPAAYDVVVNISRFSPTDCARIVLNLLQAVEHRRDVAREFPVASL